MFAGLTFCSENCTYFFEQSRAYQSLKIVSVTNGYATILQTK